MAREQHCGRDGPPSPGARASLLLALRGRLPGSPAPPPLAGLPRDPGVLRTTPGAASPAPTTRDCRPTARQEGGQKPRLETRRSVGHGEEPATSPLPFILPSRGVPAGSGWGTQGRAQGLPACAPGEGLRPEAAPPVGLTRDPLRGPRDLSGSRCCPGRSRPSASRATVSGGRRAPCARSPPVQAPGLALEATRARASLSRCWAPGPRDLLPGKPLEEQSCHPSGHA